jgi:hypothetical protein
LSWKSNNQKSKIMFNLDNAIANWRRQMVAAGIKNPTPLDELESHLREEVERQTRSGATSEKAFEIAVGRVGDANTLEAEFAKARGNRGLAEKLMIAVCILFVSFIVFLSAVTLFFCYPNSGDRIVGSAAIICSLVAACYWSWAVPFLPVIQDSGKRNVAALACILAGWGVATFYCQVILPHFAPSVEGLLPAAGFWLMLPVAAGFGLGCGLDRAASGQTLQRT